MKTRLALVAAQGCVLGPWMRARGNETGIRIKGLQSGSCIISHVEVMGVKQPPIVLYQDGTWPLPDKWTKIQFAKNCPDEDESRTHVELLVV